MPSVPKVTNNKKKYRISGVYIGTQMLVNKMTWRFIKSHGGL